jgi:hypothetical protein
MNVMGVLKEHKNEGGESREEKKGIYEGWSTTFTDNSALHIDICPRKKSQYYENDAEYYLPDYGWFLFYALSWRNLIRGCHVSAVDQSHFRIFIFIPMTYFFRWKHPTPC